MQKKDFYILNPTDEAGLRNRFDVMGAMLEMLKMRFMSNPILATASLEIMRDYADYLCGSHVWGFVVQGASGPIACPSIRHVRNYDQAIRELQAKLMKSGKDFKAALEAAMLDGDTRMLNFTTPFGMEAHTNECKALSAPALREIYSDLPNPEKRTLAMADRDQVQDERSAQAKNRAKTKANKAEKAKGGQKWQLAILDKTPPAPPPQAHKAGRDKKGKGKGAKGGKDTRPPLPKGIKPKTADGRMVCFAHNKGEKCMELPCQMLHVCWWCHNDHVIGQPCP